MPFTLSHPAAAVVVAPLLGRLAVPSALGIGSMVPDFPYFMAVPIPRPVTHTLDSILWFAVPVGWVAYVVFERAIRAPLIELLPAPLRRRIAPRVALRSWLAVTLSLAVGAFTHVLWDAITHSSVASVGAIPPLADLVRAIARLPSSSFASLQYGSSAVGAIALVAYARHWVRRTPVRAEDEDAASVLDDRTRALARLAAAGVPFAVGLAVAVWLGPTVRDVASFTWFAVHGVVAGVSSAVALLAASGLCLRWMSGWGRLA